MIDEPALSCVTPETAAGFAAQLSPEDIALLVARLDSAEDKIRYPAFLVLRARSEIKSDVYPFWTVFEEKLTSENSYQRSIGAMLTAVNARHDKNGRMNHLLPGYLALLNDPKPITVRQCAQALPEILQAQPWLAEEILKALLQVDVLQYKETMRKLILTDFLEVLLYIRTIQPSEELEAYLFSALNGSVLDEKSKKLIRQRMEL